MSETTKWLENFIQEQIILGPTLKIKDWVATNIQLLIGDQNESNEKLKKINILFIDKETPNDPDEDFTYTSLCFALEDHEYKMDTNCNIDVARNGSESLSLLKQKKYDFVIIDINLATAEEISTQGNNARFQIGENILHFLDNLDNSRKPQKIAILTKIYSDQEIAQEHKEINKKLKEIIKDFITKNQPNAFFCPKPFLMDDIVDLFLSEDDLNIDICLE